MNVYGGLLTAVFVLAGIFSAGEAEASLDEFMQQPSFSAFAASIADSEKDLEIFKAGFGYVSGGNLKSGRAYFWEALALNIYMGKKFSFCLSPFNSAYFKTNIPEALYAATQKNVDANGEESTTTAAVNCRAGSFSKYYMPLHFRYYIFGHSGRFSLYTGAGPARYKYKKQLEISSFNNVSFERFNETIERITPCFTAGGGYFIKKWKFTVEYRVLKSYRETKGLLNIFNAGAGFKFN